MVVLIIRKIDIIRIIKNNCLSEKESYKVHSSYFINFKEIIDCLNQSYQDVLDAFEKTTATYKLKKSQSK